MAGPKRPRRRSLSAEERALWDHVAQSIRRIKPDQQESLVAETEDTIDAPVPKTAARKKYRTVAAPVEPVRKPLPPPLLAHGDVAGLDKRTAQRLKRGRLGIEDRLDLHGHTQAAAHRTLERFLQDAFINNKRTVLVITGKGDAIAGKPGILKQAVPDWFNEMPMRQWVAGFSYAAAKDGGEGALYVRIRRRK
ncbi:MAG: Smr/MutS family protein [Rhodospirillales bacterium]